SLVIMSNLKENTEAYQSYYSSIGNKSG
ncbi:hypothetical protein KM1_140830, partial [Entamoeba histolytica HM-3:IMSS]